MPSGLSENPQLTPNGGYTYLVMPLVLWMLSSFSMSVPSSWMSLRFSSMREGVTDLARTDAPRATDVFISYIKRIERVGDLRW